MTVVYLVKEEMFVYKSFIHGVSVPCHEYQLRLDVQRFLWPVYYIALLPSAAKRSEAW